MVGSIVAVAVSVLEGEDEAVSVAEADSVAEEVAEGVSEGIGVIVAR